MESSLEWTVCLYKENWRKTGLLTLLILLVCCLVYLGLRDWIFVVLTVLFLAGSVISFFLPIRYIFTSDEVRVITPLSRKIRKWAEFKSYYVDPNGILLSPFLKKSRLERFRGIYLIRGNRQEGVTDFIRDKICNC